MKIVFDLEGRDDTAAFFALYAGLRLYKECKQTQVPDGQMSIAAAEAYIMLNELKELRPKWYRECEEEWEEVGWLNRIVTAHGSVARNSKSRQYSR